MNSLIYRALVHAARLFYSAKPIDKTIGKLEQQLKDHLEKQPFRVRASGIFLRQVVSVLSHKAGGAGGAVQRITQQQAQQRLVQTQQKFKPLPTRWVAKLEEAAVMEGYKKQQ